MPTAEHAAPAEASSKSLEEILATLAASDLERFRRFFRRILETAPEQATRTAIRHLAGHERGPAERYMILLLTTREDYLPVLFNPDFLPSADARRIAAAMAESDAGYLVKFSRAVEARDGGDTRSLARALDLLSVLDDLSVLVPCLRGLTDHPDSRIRSKAVMALCRLRPNPTQVERQLQSEDPRVRASAIEAVWNAKGKEVTSVFRVSLNDGHHRVVANALLGLHYGGDPSAFERIVALTTHESPMFRSAMAWALGYIRDPRAIPTIETLVKDPLANVRRSAVRALAVLKTVQAASLPPKQDESAEPQELVETPGPAAAPPPLEHSVPGPDSKPQDDEPAIHHLSNKFHSGGRSFT